MTLLFQLLLAHLIGDFALQPRSWIADKQKNKHRSPRLYQHLAVHTLLLLVFINTGIIHYWPAILVVLLSHWVIDVIKLHVRGYYNERFLFFTDQALHIAVIVGVAMAYHPPQLFAVLQVPAHSLWLLAIALATVTFVSAIVIRIAISAWTPHTEEKQDESLALAGRYIGMLERLFVFAFVVLHQWEGIGFLLAAKSVFRFGDLTASKDRKLTEYILIGTLLSFGTAILVGLLFLRVEKALY